MSVHRLPDGTTVFLCGRNTGKTVTREEQLARWIGEEAVKQERCPLCLSPLAEHCGHEAETGCQRPLATPAKAYAILNGMVLG